MYERVAVEHLLYCSTASTAQHSTAQHSAITPHQVAKQARADQSPTTQASTQSFHCTRYSTTASTARHSAISPHKAAEQVLADQSERQRKQADRVGEGQHMWSTYGRLSSRNEQRNQKLPGLQNYTWHNYSQSAGVTREGFASSFNLNKKTQHCSLSRPFYLVHACGVRVVIVEHGALGSCKSSVCTQNRGPLCPLHSFPFSCILPCERA